MDLEEHVEELIPAYALGCLDEEDAATVAAHLIDCDQCRESLGHYQVLVDDLALAAPDAVPPDGLHSKLLTRILPITADSPSSNKSVRQKLWRPVGIWGVVSAAVILILIASNIAMWSFATRPQPTPTPRPNVMKTIPLFPTEAVPNAHGMIVIGLDGYHGAVVVEDLAPLKAGEIYQFWLADGENKTSAGLFSVDENGYEAITISAPMPLSEYSGFGITIEPEGGYSYPHGDRVLRWGTERGRKP